MDVVNVSKDSVSELLQTFNPITLDEMEGVKLLDRTDTKFVFNYMRLPEILDQLKEYYKILDISGVRKNRYESLYFDTDTFKLYLDHHNGRANRYKIRYRKYMETNDVFFEVKFKTNKGRTVKNRIKCDVIENEIKGRAKELINERTYLCPDHLQAKLWVNYSRITLVNKSRPERLTIDTALEYKDSNQIMRFPNMIIAEVKQKKAASSPFIKIVKDRHIYPCGISKYCFGVVTLINGIKKNNFKPKVLTVNKICNGA